MNAQTQKRMTDGTRGSRSTGQISCPMLIIVLGVLTAIFYATSGHAAENVIVLEDFGGSGDPLNGTTADTFDSAITDAGGSSTWVASDNYTDAGDIYGQSGAHLSLGSYINDAQGTADGKFILSATFAGPATNSWQSFGFFQTTSPALGQFAANGGMATLIYRNTGELDGFGGPNTDNAVDGDVVSGSQLLTVVLDLTPDGGYNGSDNFGTVTFLDGDFDTGLPIADPGPTTYTYTSAQTFGSMGLSGSQSGQEGTILNLELRQITQESRVSGTVLYIR